MYNHPLMRLSETLEGMSERLRGVSETPELDAQVLLAHILERPRSWLLAHPEAELPPTKQSLLMENLLRLENGVPLPYVVGHWEFYGIDFIVTPDVLIPRPETELMVEEACKWLVEHPGRRQAADIGTGTGCIAIALATQNQDLTLLATDISCAALEVARRNAEMHGVQKRIAFRCCDLFPDGGEEIEPSEEDVGNGWEIPSRGFDLVCANLPYIPTTVLHSLPIFEREPTLALDGGPDGLDQIRRLLAVLPKAIAPGGLGLLEIEAGAGQTALELAKNAFPKARSELHQDLAGRERIIRIEW